MTTTITPSQGSGVDFVQQGIGASPGYAAIDARRAAYLGLLQGCIGSSATGAYTVAQRGLGANMSVDIAANAGSLLVAGTSISNQSFYTVPPHSGVINETIATADATNPRIDQIVVRTYDNALDSSGKNSSETAVLTGTPTSGATFVNRNGAAALPANAYRLADIFVGAGVSSITNAFISDRRPKTRGHCNIATSETRSNTVYGTLTTPDQVNEIVLPTDGLIVVGYQATWQESVAGAGRAAIFLGANEIKMALGTTAAPNAAATEAVIPSGGPSANATLASFPGGLSAGSALVPYTGDVTTGQALGIGVNGGGPCYLFAAAGTYNVSVAFKSTSGSVTVANRKLWVWTMAPDQAVLA